MGEGAQGTGSHSPQEPAMCLNECDSPIARCQPAVCRDRLSLNIGWRQPVGQHLQAGGIREQKPGPFPAACLHCLLHVVAVLSGQTHCLLVNKFWGMESQICIIAGWIEARGPPNTHTHWGSPH